MYAKWMGPCGIFAVLLWVAPLATLAQGYYYRDEGERGAIRVTNDWRDGVRITLWTHRRERIGGSWMIDPGDSAFLMVGETRIKVRPTYKIKVGDDWGWVNVGEVGQLQDGVWYVNVREVWRATHRDRPYRRENAPSRPENVPDYLR